MANQAGFPGEFVAGGEVGSAAGEDHFLLLLDELLFVGVRGPDSANGLDRSLPDKVIAVFEQRANSAHRQFDRADLFGFNGRKQRERPAPPQDQDFGGGRAGGGIEAAPVAQQIIGDLVILELAERADGRDRDRLRRGGANGFQQRVANGGGFQSCGGADRLDAFVNRQVRVVDGSQAGSDRGRVAPE